MIKKIFRSVLVLAMMSPLAASAQSMSDTYSFMYTATWDIPMNTFIKSTVQRIKIPTTDYEDLKAKFIESFMQQIVVPAPPAADGAAGVAQGQIKLSLDPEVKEADLPLVLAFDIGSAFQSVQNGSNPAHMAEWAFHFWQMSLWEWYVTNQTLLLQETLTLDDVDRFSAISQMQREPIWSWKIDEEDPSAEPTEWVQVNREFPALAPYEPGVADLIKAFREIAATQQGKMTMPQAIPQQMETFDYERNTMYRVFQEAAFAIDATDHDRYFGLINRIRERQEARNRYYDWVADRKALVIDFVEKWARKYDGTEIDIDGVVYLVTDVYEEPMQFIPRNAVNLIVDRKGTITPYDVLDRETGAIKQPVPIED